MSARRIAVLVFAALLAAAAAQAADDGGTRSPFASGAGIRALGLGSAYVGLADDASAAIWNPGGLANLSRFEVQTSFTRYDESGASESYWGLAAPSWRLGTAAISLRHLGLGGIEARNDRNVMTGADFSDSQTEFALAYGRGAGERWGLGGALKLQRQSLAGVSAAGLGADLGVTLRPLGLEGEGPRWLEGVTLGFALKNAWQPRLRLDQDEVPDPTTLQSGLAVRRLVGDGATLLATFDLEQPRDLAARLHAGAELRIGPVLAIRTGLDRGRLTAGTSLAWREMSIEYGFEDRDLGARQRIGVTHAFGPSTSQSRLAAREREERMVQTRLDAAYGERQKEQLAELRARAESFLAGGRFDDALDVLTTLQTLAPGDASARALESRCHREKGAALEREGDLTGAAVAFGRALALAPGDAEAAAGRDRCRLESGRRSARTAERKRRYDEAFDWFLAGELSRARTGFAALVAEDRGDVDAAAMLNRTDQAISRRALERPAPVAAGPRRPAPVATAVAAGPVANGIPALSREQSRMIEELYRRGVAAMEARRPAEAVRYWEAVWSMQQGYQRTAEYLLREYLVLGMESYAAGKLDQAINIWEKAVRVDSGDTRAQAYLARAREQKARARALVEDAP